MQRKAKPMAASGKTTKATAKSSEKNKEQVKKLKRLPGFFSFSNKKFVALTVFVVGFAIAGSYWLYESSSAADTKDLRTVQGCRKAGKVLREGSRESCVAAVQVVLSYASNSDIYRNATWGALRSDGIYGPKTAVTVAAYQEFVNRSTLSQVRGYVAVDGIVGPDTWWYLENVACPAIKRVYPTLYSCKTT